MEYQTESNNFGQAPVSYEDKRSTGFATASIVMGIIAIATCCCIYTSIVCGALAIIFALLSRGGEMTMDGKAKVGLALGIVGFIVAIIVLIVAVIYCIYYFGGMDGLINYVNQYSEKYMQSYQ